MLTVHTDFVLHAQATVTGASKTVNFNNEIRREITAAQKTTDIDCSGKRQVAVSSVQ